MKTKRIFHIEVTEEKRDAIFSILDECEQESEISHLQSKLHFFAQHLKAFFTCPERSSVPMRYREIGKIRINVSA